MALPINALKELVVAKRGRKGVRAAAVDIGISPATLSRVERGNLPDLNTFALICKWLERDPREFLGIQQGPTEGAPAATVHFRKDPTVKAETAAALGELILAAQKEARARNSFLG